ncbi:predicted protein [Histoplasma capsulatum var. duboisii H88]|uniref:Predicted protein n=1 Tax=Ajellomyces capsulatus (strain H88) TaxID=544711 RepID=F0ULT4_AJEC8|nr:predicted protein [Histoplasma capsulatum var. duboisii H88]
MKSYTAGCYGSDILLLPNSLLSPGRVVAVLTNRTWERGQKPQEAMVVIFKKTCKLNHGIDKTGVEKGIAG